MVFDWLRRRRLSDEGRRRLLVSLARAEEALVETHVRNALNVLESVGEEMSLDRALELYLEAMDPGDSRAEIIARRVLARLEQVEEEDEEEPQLTRARSRRRSRLFQG